jgi:hypothetical protein
LGYKGGDQGKRGEKMGREKEIAFCDPASEIEQTLFLSHSNDQKMTNSKGILLSWKAWI